MPFKQSLNPFFGFPHKVSSKQVYELIHELHWHVHDETQGNDILDEWFESGGYPPHRRYSRGESLLKPLWMDDDSQWNFEFEYHYRRPLIVMATNEKEDAIWENQQYYKEDYRNIRYVIAEIPSNETWTSMWYERKQRSFHLMDFCR